MTPRTGNQKEKYRHEKTRKVRWMQEFGPAKDAERDGNETDKKEGKRDVRRIQRSPPYSTQRTTHDDFLTFSLHSQPLYASSPKYYCSSPLHHLPNLHGSHRPASKIPFSNIQFTLQIPSLEFQVIKFSVDAFHNCVCVHKEDCHVLMSVK